MLLSTSIMKRAKEMYGFYEINAFCTCITCQVLHHHSHAPYPISVNYSTNSHDKYRRTESVLPSTINSFSSTRDKSLFSHALIPGFNATIKVNTQKQWWLGLGILFGCSHALLHIFVMNPYFELKLSLIYKLKTIIEYCKPNSLWTTSSTYTLKFVPV